MLVNREGRFKARILESGVSETGNNHLTTFTARFGIEQELGGDRVWYDISAESLEITGYFYIEKRDGSLNTFTINALGESLGWDGRELFWLQDTDLSDRLVQITVALEEYDGKVRPKVKYINHEDAEPMQGVQKADQSQRTAITNRLGSKLRANAGGAPRPAPAPRTAKPDAPQTKPPVQAAANTPHTATADEAWTAFIEACPGSMSADAREREWFRILGEMFTGKIADQLSAAEWQTFIDDGPRQIVPF